MSGKAIVLAQEGNDGTLGGKFHGAQEDGDDIESFCVGAYVSAMLWPVLDDNNAVDVDSPMLRPAKQLDPLLQ